MRTAIFGGSFNPVHLGHIFLAEEVRRIGYQRILFIPASEPPHRNLVGNARDAHRLAMLELALADLPWAELWDGEIRRGGVSYSIDTVEELKKTGILHSRPGLIIGDDLVEGFSAWKDADRLAELTDLIVARRGAPLAVLPYPHRRLNNEIRPQSSSLVRRLIAEKGNLQGVLSPEVEAYILREKLYADLD